MFTECHESYVNNAIAPETSDSEVIANELTSTEVIKHTHIHTHTHKHTMSGSASQVVTTYSYP